MKFLVIGGVAAGTKVAAKLKRCDRSADVTIITRDRDISYAGCGLPYFVGGFIKSRDELIVNTPQKYSSLTGVTVLTGREAVKLDHDGKTVTAKNLESGTDEFYPYDKLIIAVGASAVLPPVEGIDKDGVFTMRTPDDAAGIRAYIDAEGVSRAVVIGGGFIGLEAADNLYEKGIRVTVIDIADQILPGVFDREMADFIKRHLIAKGIDIITGTKVEKILGDGKVAGVTTDLGELDAQLVIAAAGIRPNTGFLADSGIEMFKDTIVVDGHLKTNIDDVYAIGDCAMVTNRITGKPQWSPMGSSANMEGRTLAQILTGVGKTYPGVLGTGIVKLPGLNCGRTGLNERQAKDAGYDVETVIAVTDDKAHYYPGAAFFITKLIADRKSHKLLGAQIVGPGAVDKMTDIAVMAANSPLEIVENADFAYAPPFSTAIHPFVQAAYILLNKIEGDLVSITPAEYTAGKADDYRVIDVAPAPSIKNAFFVALDSVTAPIDGLGKDEKLLLICVRGKRAYFLQNRLKALGYTNTAVLEGATTFNRVTVDENGFPTHPKRG